MKSTTNSEQFEISSSADKKTPYYFMLQYLHEYLKCSFNLSGGLYEMHLCNIKMGEGGILSTSIGFIAKLILKNFTKLMALVTLRIF